jgi:hypothetical protein
MTFLLNLADSRQLRFLIFNFHVITSGERYSNNRSIQMAKHVKCINYRGKNAKNLLS